MLGFFFKYFGDFRVVDGLRRINLLQIVWPSGICFSNPSSGHRAGQTFKCAEMDMAGSAKSNDCAALPKAGAQYGSCARWDQSGGAG